MSFTPPASGAPEPPPETPRQREERRREEHRRDLALTESRRAFNEIPQIQAYVLTETYIQYEGDTEVDRKSTRLNSSHVSESRMPSSA